MILRSILIISTVLAVAVCDEFDFTVQVAAGRIQCYFQTIPTDQPYVHMDIDYQVINGGDLNINFLMSNPQSVVLANEQLKTDGYHRVDITQVKGDYQICFDNTFSYQSAKTVFFEILLYDSDGRTDTHLIDKSVRDQLGTIPTDLGVELDHFNSLMARVKTNLNKAEHFQSLLRAFEARDRAIMEANFDRVNFWSIFNGVVMLSVSLVQVYTIRSLFDENSKLRKFLHRRH